MRSSIILRIVSVALVALFAFSALDNSASSLATQNTNQSSISQDFLVASDLAASGLQDNQETAVQDVETLIDWQFTLRLRPAKCRFIP